VVYVVIPDHAAAERPLTRRLQHWARGPCHPGAGQRRPRWAAAAAVFLQGSWAISIVLARLLVRYYWRWRRQRRCRPELLTASVMPARHSTGGSTGVSCSGSRRPPNRPRSGAAGGLRLAFHARRSPEAHQGAVFLTAKTTAMVCCLFAGSALSPAVFAILAASRC